MRATIGFLPGTSGLYRLCYSLSRSVPRIITRCLLWPEKGTAGSVSLETNGGRIDKQPGSPYSEIRHKCLCGADRPHHIRVDHANDLLIRKTFQWTRQAVAGIIENHMDSTRGHDFFGHALDLLGIGDIQCHQFDTGDLSQLRFLFWITHGSYDSPAL
jgi:hypothetical protein